MPECGISNQAKVRRSKRRYYEITSRGFALLARLPEFAPHMQWILLYQEAFELAEADRPHRAGEQPEGESHAEADPTEDPEPGAEVLPIRLFKFKGKDVRTVLIDGKPGLRSL